jgi:hypothetical protein
MLQHEKIERDYEWGATIRIVLCEACDWKFLQPSDQKESRCPHCFSSDLVFVANDQLEIQPELYLPFKINESSLTQPIQRFVSGIWFPPIDLTYSNLSKRLKQVYLPVWLVDSQVIAQWQAEAGFNYQVVSHQDRFDGTRNGWSSREVTETRVRWEPRLGRLVRTYQNITVPAIEEHAVLLNKLGGYSFDQALAYDPKILLEPPYNRGVFIRLNDRSQQDAWPDAIPGFQRQAASDCQAACSADHIRNFNWNPEFQDQHWSLLLLPALTTYYVDDENHPQSLVIHGQTGRLYGIRRASMKRARKTALWMVGIAVIIFMISLIGALSSQFLPGLLLLATVGWVLAILLGVAAIVPLILVWWINRTPNPFSS